MCSAQKGPEWHILLSNTAFYNNGVKYWSIRAQICHVLKDVCVTYIGKVCSCAAGWLNEVKRGLILEFFDAPPMWFDVPLGAHVPQFAVCIPQEILQTPQQHCIVPCRSHRVFKFSPKTAINYSFFRRYFWEKFTMPYSEVLGILEKRLFT